MEATVRFCQLQLPDLWIFSLLSTSAFAFISLLSKKATKWSNILKFSYLNKRPCSDTFCSIEFKLLSQKLWFYNMGLMREVCECIWAQVRLCEPVCIICLVIDILCKATPSKEISKTIQSVNQDIQIERNHLAFFKKMIFLLAYKLLKCL